MSCSKNPNIQSSGLQRLSQLLISELQYARIEYRGHVHFIRMEILPEYSSIDSVDAVP